MKAGDVVHGQTVDTVLGESPRVAVYTTRDGQLRWNYAGNGGTVPPGMQPAIVRFDDLMGQVKSRIPTPYRLTAYTQLGKALFSALDGNEPTRIAEAFAPVAGVIDDLAKQDARLTYMIAFIVSVSALGLTTAVLAAVVGDGLTSQLLQAGACGAMGAAISILHRSRQIDVDPLSGSSLLRVQGAARGMLGMLFGVFIVLAIRGDIVFGFVSDRPEALLPVAVAAGFSERLVPELMARFENLP